MSIPEQEHSDLLEQAKRALPDDGHQTDDPPVAFWVPGRVEFLGKHTDYAGGRSLLCAIDRGICIVARARRDSRCHVIDAVSRQSIHASLYASTVIKRLRSNFPDARTGADLAFTSNLPQAAGMSSSSALIVSIALAIAAVNRLSETSVYRTNIKDAADLADYLGCVEGGYDYRALAGDRGVGTLSGCEDQTAMLCSRPDALVQYSFCPVRFEDSAPLPKGHHLAIGVSGVVAEKTASALEHYNVLSRKAAAIARAWQFASGRTQDRTIADAVRAGGAVRDCLSRSVEGFSSDELRDRFDQFWLESERLVPAAATALRKGDLAELGALVDQSQAAAERFLKNQVPETVALARSARELGAVAASAFGAGFGGSVWALVSDDQTDFLDRWRAEYERAFPVRREKAVFFLTRAGPPATQLA